MRFYNCLEVIGAVVSILVIWQLTGILVYMAIQRVISSDYEIQDDVMLVVAIIGLIFNFM